MKKKIFRKIIATLAILGIFILPVLSFPSTVFAANTLKVLVVAGAGGSAAGAGGAGEYVYNSSFTVTEQTYNVVVGGGGTAGLGSGDNPGGVGGTSTFATIVALGGGRGGVGGWAGTYSAAGGSGGGQGTEANNMPAGASTASQGLGSAGGGNGNPGTDAPPYASGGGGGSGSAGSVAPSNSTGGAGGNGTANSITGSSVTYACGGGGGVFQAGGTGGAAGCSTAGAGASNAQGGAATANTGSSCGGSGQSNGCAGAAGVVIISWVTANYTTNCTAGGGVATTDGANTVCTFNSNGTLTVSLLAPVPPGPTNLQVESQSNPTNVATSNPRFSSIYQNASSTALATSYQIQIATSSTYWGAPYWDSGQKTLSSSTPPNMRTPQIFSTTTFPLDGSNYYWRMKFWDQFGTTSDWSTSTASFTMTIGASLYATTTLQDLTYSYDALGNITQIVDKSGNNNTGTTTYSYDGLYRLQGATTTNSYANYTQSYVYDWLGNITNKSDQGAYAYAGTGYANPDAVTTIGTQNYTYDNAGDILTSGNGSATTSYTWDYRNRMTDTNNSLGGATTTHYAYDSDGQRVQMDVKKGAAATTTTKFFNQYYEVMGATTTMYIYAGGQLLATIEGNGKSTTTAMVHTDHQGSTAVTSSATGTLLTLNSYYPYGDLRMNQKNTTFDEQRKSLGQFYDDSTSLNYYNARFMSGSKGQFMSQDPILIGAPAPELLFNPQILNFYGYSADNPINKTDPSGLLVSEYQPYLSAGNSYSPGETMGGYRGISIYSRGSGSALGARSDLQCVAFAQSFAASQFGITLGGTGNAVAYGNQSALNSSMRANNNSGTLTAYKNGGSIMPQENDIISWSNGTYANGNPKEGHVGVIAEVSFDKKSGSGMVYSIEQNANPNRALFVQPFTQNKDGTYTVGDRMSGYNVQGWARYGNQSTVPTYSTTPATPAPKTPIKNK